MVDESSPVPPAPGPQSGPADAGRCPWCSAVLPTPGAAVCPTCQARLVEEEEVEIPGVTSVYPDLLASSAAPRKIKRTFGALFVGDDNDVSLPSEAELPAIAPPDLEVRREMLRLELDARLAALQAEVTLIESESGARPALPVEPAEAGEPVEEPAPEPSDAAVGEPPAGEPPAGEPPAGAE
jgi:hypothetical protein